MATTPLRVLSLVLCFSSASAVCDPTTNLCSTAISVFAATKGDEVILVADTANFTKGNSLKLFQKATPAVFEVYTIKSIFGDQVYVTPRLVKAYKVGTQVVESPPLPVAPPGALIGAITPTPGPLVGTTTKTAWDSSASSGSYSLASSNSGSLHGESSSSNSASDSSNSLSSGSTASGSWGSYLQMWQWFVLALCLCCCCIGGAGAANMKNKKKPKKKNTPKKTAPVNVESAPEPVPEAVAVTEPLVNTYKQPMPVMPPIMPSYSMVQEPVYNQGMTYAAPATTAYMAPGYNYGQGMSYAAPQTASYMMPPTQFSAVPQYATYAQN